MSDPSDAAKQGEAPLPDGVKVEVRTGFDRSWASGFVVADVSEDGYLVRRRSDGEVLPHRFPRADVRRERKNLASGV